MENWETDKIVEETEENSRVHSHGASCFIGGHIYSEDSVGHGLVPCRPLFFFIKRLEDTARYAGLLAAPAEGFGFWPRFSLPGRKPRAYYAVLAHFRPFLVSSSNLSNF